ncbi:MAG: hypothetical protein U5O39_18120 [Gammaproteobacteria bacterium]|nr:hypothetical protein [Gammaproteobacteria bacterium]
MKRRKETLETIANNPFQSDAERTIARALKNVEHFPADEDKAELKAIANDDEVPGPVRQLARITHDLAHKVSPEDRKILSEIISE